MAKRKSMRPWLKAAIIAAIAVLAANRIPMVGNITGPGA